MKNIILRAAKIAFKHMLIECKFDDSVKNTYLKSFLYYLEKELDILKVVQSEEESLIGKKGDME